MNTNSIQATGGSEHSLRVRAHGREPGLGVSCARYELHCRCGKSFGTTSEIKFAVLDRGVVAGHIAELVEASAPEVVAHRAEFGLSDPGPETFLDHAPYRVLRGRGDVAAAVDFQI